MLRQCAWCLRLIDLVGKRLSTQPLPKLYEASHGMCSVCGALWMEEVLASLTPQGPACYLEECYNQEVASISQDVSSAQYAVDLSVQYQTISHGPVVCEHYSEYLPLCGSSLAERPETGLNEGLSGADRPRANLVTSLSEDVEMPAVATDTGLLQ